MTYGEKFEGAHHHDTGCGPLAILRSSVERGWACTFNFTITLWWEDVQGMAVPALHPSLDHCFQAHPFSAYLSVQCMVETSHQTSKTNVIPAAIYAESGVYFGRK